MLELRGITLWRSDRRVFDGLDLQITGHRVGLIGPNGAGKSSLLRLVQGLLVPDAGSIDFAHSFTTEATPRCGFVFQNPDQQILFPTVMEELCFGQLEQGASPAEAAETARALAHRYGAKDLLDLPTHALSEGQKQRLCILSVLADQPDLLLLDEPFASLDRQALQAMRTMLAAVPQPLIMASHMLGFFSDFDEVVWLAEGRVVLQGEPARVLAAYEASDAESLPDASAVARDDKNMASP